MYHCPGCKRQTVIHMPNVYFERYPNIVCNDCTLQTRTQNGSKIWFAHADINGGYIGLIDEISKFSNVSADGKCYVHNTLCYAIQVRSGAIIICVNMHHKKRMLRWKTLSKIIGRLQVIYWQSVISANSPFNKNRRGSVGEKVYFNLARGGRVDYSFEYISE